MGEDKVSVHTYTHTDFTHTKKIVLNLLSFEGVSLGVDGGVSVGECICYFISHIDIPTPIHSRPIQIHI